KSDERAHARVIQSRQVPYAHTLEIQHPGRAMAQRQIPGATFLRRQRDTHDLAAQREWTRALHAQRDASGRAPGGHYRVYLLDRVRYAVRRLQLLLRRRLVRTKIPDERVELQLQKQVA